MSRYRGLALLAAVVLSQLLLVGYQVRTQGEVRLVRVWAARLIEPPGRAIATSRQAVAAWWTEYIWLRGAREENRRLREEVERLKAEVKFLRGELATAERAAVLTQFRQRLPMQTLAARIIAASGSFNHHAVFVDRGAKDGVRTGMAVINPAGLVGKVVAAYPSTSQVVLVTAEGFSAGVVSPGRHTLGVLKGTGRNECEVLYIQHDEPIKLGDWFYTSGEDRIFPRGLVVGQVKNVGGQGVFRKVVVRPAFLERGIEEVLVVTAAVHMSLPDEKPVPAEAPLLPSPGLQAPAGDAASVGPRQPNLLETDADKLLRQYRPEAPETETEPRGQRPAVKGRPAQEPRLKTGAPTP